MMLLKMVNKMNWLKKRNAHQTTDTSNLVLKTDYNTKPNEIEKNILIMLNILLLKNLIS